MAAATSRLAHHAFITPMAAVAGAVADEMLAAMLEGRTLAKAYVNDGGDIALHVGEGETLRLAIAGTGHGFDDRFAVTHDSPVRGVATSGWRGRSFSLGIADAVTVLARDAPSADAAATLIANAVDLPGHPAITRAPASRLQPDSDLGERLVTTGVGSLSADDVAVALSGGLDIARDFLAKGLIEGAALFLAGSMRIVGRSLLPGSRGLLAPLPLNPPRKGEGISDLLRSDTAARKAGPSTPPSPLRGGVRGGVVSAAVTTTRKTAHA